MKKYTKETSGAFVNTFEIKPNRQGVLDNLTFAVKDNIHVKGYKTSYGSKAWLAAHPIECVHAFCVEQLLNAGATCLGKTVSDEFTYSLDGESFFYGTPVNPKAPDHIPGGSSSGSASAVACGLVDFALGTDNAGSIRVPASLCGIWGMRPTTHRVSEAGVLPFVPSVSTVGAFARNAETLAKVMRVLLSSQEQSNIPVQKIYLVEDAFNTAAEEISDAVRSKLSKLSHQSHYALESIDLSTMLGQDISLSECNEEALRVVQTAEVWNSFGSWIKANSPEMGEHARSGLQNVEELDRHLINDARMMCESIYQKLKKFIQPGVMLCYPTVPVLPPLKGELDDFSNALDFYLPTMNVTALAGIGRLPEISVPGLTVNQLPVGLSFVAGTYQDEFLLDAVRGFFDFGSEGCQENVG